MIYTAEALAILYAIEYIHQHALQKIVIFSNSFSVLRSLSSSHIAYSENFVIYRLKQQLYALRQANLDCVLVWIPAYTGILGNETADYLAKRAITYGTLIPRGLPYTDFYS